MRYVSAQRELALSERHISILRLLAHGYTSRRIAQQMNLSVNTINWYISVIKGRLGCATRTETVLKAQHRGLLTSLQHSFASGERFQ